MALQLIFPEEVIKGLQALDEDERARVMALMARHFASADREGVPHSAIERVFEEALDVVRMDEEGRAGDAVLLDPIPPSDVRWRYGVYYEGYGTI